MGPKASYFSHFVCAISAPRPPPDTIVVQFNSDAFDFSFLGLLGVRLCPIGAYLCHRGRLGWSGTSPDDPNVTYKRQSGASSTWGSGQP